MKVNVNQSNTETFKEETTIKKEALEHFQKLSGKSLLFENINSNTIL